METSNTKFISEGGVHVNGRPPFMFACSKNVGNNLVEWEKTATFARFANFF